MILHKVKMLPATCSCQTVCLWCTRWTLQASRESSNCWHTAVFIHCTNVLYGYTQYTWLPHNILCTMNNLENPLGVVWGMVYLTFLIENILDLFLMFILLSDIDNSLYHFTTIFSGATNSKQDFADPNIKIKCSLR